MSNFYYSYCIFLSGLAVPVAEKPDHPATAETYTHKDTQECQTTTVDHPATAESCTYKDTQESQATPGNSL